MKMKQLHLLLWMAHLSLAAWCQPNLIDAVYNVQPTTRAFYGWEQRLNYVDGSHGGLPYLMEMDIYRPANLPQEGTILRPVVMMCHGVLEYKDEPRWIAMGKSLAQRGYVAVSINYRHDPSHFGDIIAAANACGTAPCKLAHWNRSCYENAMDIHKAIQFLTTHAASYQIDPNRFILMGHSMGSGAIIHAATVSKPEVAQFFPAGFLTDSWYTDFDQNHARIKGAVLFGPILTDLSFIDASDAMPMFLFGGTHDPVTPYYSGRQLCTDETNPLMYGAGALAQRIDGLSPNVPYYLIEARGVGHTMHLVTPQPYPNYADDLQMLYFPDMLRFMRTTILDGYVNQVHKLITPINSSPYDYCDEITNAPLMNGMAETFLQQMLFSGGGCFQFPSFTLSTMPWSGPAYLLNSPAWTFSIPTSICGAYLKQDDAEPSVVDPALASPTLYPNPSDGHTRLTLPEPLQEQTTVQVMNAQGQVVLTAKIAPGQSTLELNLSAHPSGIYSLQWQRPNGINAIMKLIRQ